MSRSFPVRRTLPVAYDAVAAVGSVAFLLAVPFLLAHDALGSPLSKWTARGVLLALGIVGAYPFLLGDWSLARLTDFSLAALLAGLGGAVAFVFTTGGVDTDSLAASAATVGVVGFAYLVGAGYVLYRQRRHDTDQGAGDEWL